MLEVAADAGGRLGEVAHISLLTKSALVDSLAI